MSTQLMPCPFCGSSNIDAEGWSTCENITGPACSDCGAMAGTFGGTSEDNIAAWNTRTPPKQTICSSCESSHNHEPWCPLDTHEESHV